MAIAREVENCPNCGKPLKSRHKNMGNDFVGDTFLGYEPCDCKEGLPDKKDELLPCPFCGGKAVLRNYNTSGLWMISCLNNCGVLMAAQCKIPTNDPEIIDVEIKKNVVLAWNRRRDWIAGYEYRKATSSPPEPSSKEQENDAVGFADWMDEKQKSRQLVRLKDNKIKWFYNHKPEAKEGKQQWIHYTTEQLYQLYKSNHEK